MTAQNNRSLEVLKKVGIYAFWFFTLFGLAGSTIMILRMTSGKPPRPDLELDGLLAGVPGRYTVMANRLSNQIYRADQGWEEGTTPSYSLGDLGDMFTALAICKLSDQKKLAVTDEVRKHLPNASSALDGITLAALLTHTSGILPEWSDIPSDTQLKSGETSLRATLNYTILEQVVEAVSRLPYTQFVQANVLATLELPSIQWDATKNQWIAAPKDLMLFEEYVNSNRIVSLESYLLAFTAPKLSNGEYGLYNYGWEVQNLKGLRMERMITQHDGFQGVLIRFPEKNFAAVVLYEGNAADLDVLSLSERIAVLYLGREMPFRQQEKPTH